MTTHEQSVVHLPPSSLKRMTSVFILFIIAAVLSLNGWIVYHSFQRTLQITESEADNLSISLSRHAEDTFLQVELLLQDLTERVTQYGVNSQQLAQLQQVMKTRKATLPQVNGIFIYDAEGYWLISTNEKPTANPNNADRDYFKYHQNNASSTLYIGRVIQSRSTGEMIIPVSVRLNNPDGSFGGVLLATLSLNYFKQFYNYYSIGATDVLALSLSDGHMLYGRPYGNSEINYNLSNSPLFSQHLLSLESGTATFVSAIDHVERVYGFTRLKRYPIVIITGFNKAEAFSNWKIDTGIYTTITSCLLFLIGSMGWLVLKQINVNIKSQRDLTQVRDQLTAVNHTLETLALLDGLTGLANRRQFDIFLQETIHKSTLSGKQMALIMLDVDMFKKYNDHYGHVEGDKCLQSISHILSGMPRRKEDLIARYGGEEFVIILMDITIEGAETFALRALSAIREQHIPHLASSLDNHIVTVSAGVYVFVGTESPLAAEEAIIQADRALYRAKREGRNRVIITKQAAIAQAG